MKTIRKYDDQKEPGKRRMDSNHPGPARSRPSSHSSRHTKSHSQKLPMAAVHPPEPEPPALPADVDANLIRNTSSVFVMTAAGDLKQISSDSFVYYYNQRNNEAMELFDRELHAKYRGDRLRDPSTSSPATPVRARAQSFTDAGGSPSLETSLRPHYSPQLHTKIISPPAIQGLAVSHPVQHPASLEDAEISFGTERIDILDPFQQRPDTLCPSPLTMLRGSVAPVGRGAIVGESPGRQPQLFSKESDMAATIIPATQARVEFTQNNAQRAIEELLISRPPHRGAFSPASSETSHGVHGEDGYQGRRVQSNLDVVKADA